MLWEHPLLAESLIQKFRATEIPSRSLTDNLLVDANKSAYLRAFGVDKDGNMSNKSLATFNRASGSLGGLLNYIGLGLVNTSDNKMTLEQFSETPPNLMKAQTFYWDVSCALRFGEDISWGYNYYNEIPKQAGVIWEGGSWKWMPWKEEKLGWNSWIYDDWKSCCDQAPNRCVIGKNSDARNHVRTRYRAYITPDPLEYAYYNANKGYDMGEIHSIESATVGIIGHQLNIEADVQTTRGGFGWFGLGEEGYTGEFIAEFGVIIKNFTTGDDTHMQVSVPAGASKGRFEYTFPKAGLYYIFMYLKEAGDDVITVSRNLNEQIEDNGGIGIYASHPMRLMIYVSEPPEVQEIEYTPLVDYYVDIPESYKGRLELIDDSETEGTKDLWYLYIIGGLVVGSLFLMR